MGLIGGVCVLGTMRRCTGGVLEPALQHGMELGGFLERNQLVLPVIWNSIERPLEHGMMKGMMQYDRRCDASLVGWSLL
jgi:hypothetical protein